MADTPIPALFNEAYMGQPCVDDGFKPLHGSLPSGGPLPCETSVPYFCYGGCTRSQVEIYVMDEDWFWRTMMESGKFNPDADCPAWQSRHPQCMAPDTANTTAISV